MWRFFLWMLGLEAERAWGDIHVRLKEGRIITVRYEREHTEETLPPMTEAQRQRLAPSAKDLAKLLAAQDARKGL
jgi:hypothetical protein